MKRWLSNESNFWTRAARMVTQQQECGNHGMLKQLVRMGGWGLDLFQFQIDGTIA